MPRIGVAVAVPEPWGGRLQDYRVALGDAAARGIPTHITLCPPIDVPAGGLASVVAHLDDVGAWLAPFRVRLRGTATFRPVSPVVFVAVVEGISGCERLAEAVLAGPLGIDLEFPYHPHVTVAHDVGDDLLDRAYAELADVDGSFEVDGFHLYLHDPEAGWRPERRFALTGAGA